jgi:hypothetical protein
LGTENKQAVENALRLKMEAAAWFFLSRRGGDGAYPRLPARVDLSVTLHRRPFATTHLMSRPPCHSHIFFSLFSSFIHRLKKNFTVQDAQVRGQRRYHHDEGGRHRRRCHLHVRVPRCVTSHPDACGCGTGWRIVHQQTSAAAPLSLHRSDVRSIGVVRVFFNFKLSKCADILKTTP